MRISPAKYNKVISELEKSLLDFQLRIGHKKYPGKPWLTDRLWGGALAVIGDYYGHQSPQSVREQVTFDRDPIDKSQLARYRETPPRIDQRDVHRIIRGIARMYCFLAPTPVTLKAAHLLCDMYGFSLVPGDMIFQDIKGIRKELTSVSIFDLIESLDHPVATAEYFRYGIPSALFFSILFRCDTSQTSFWRDFSQTVFGNTSTVPIGFTSSMIDEKLLYFGRYPNWEFKFKGRDNLVSSISGWLSTWRGITQATDNLNHLAERMDSIKNLVSDEIRLDLTCPEILIKAIHEASEAFKRHKTKLDFSANYYRHPIFFNNFAIQKTRPISENHKSRINFIPQNFDKYYGPDPYTAWIKSPLQHVIEYIDEIDPEYPGLPNRSGFSKSILPYWI